MKGDGVKDKWSLGGNSCIALIASTPTTIIHYSGSNLWKQAPLRPSSVQLSMKSCTQSFRPREIIHRDMRCQINPNPPNAP